MYSIGYSSLIYLFVGKKMFEVDRNSSNRIRSAPFVHVTWMYALHSMYTGTIMQLHQSRPDRKWINAMLISLVTDM